MDRIDSLINNNNEVMSNKDRRNKREEFVVIQTPHAPTDLRSMTYMELMSKDFPESEWVIDRLIPEGLTVLSAQPASFKTWLLLDIAISVASGSSLFDTFDSKQSGVLMIDEENSPRLLQQRLGLLNEDNLLPIHFMIEQNFKLDDKKVGKILKFCRSNNIKFLTFDSLVRIHSSNENDAVQMSEVFAKVRQFTKAGINVLITHHNRKSGSVENAGQDMRGSSDILASVDCHLSLKRDRSDHRLILTQTKVRFSEELPPIEMEVVATDENVKFVYVGSLEIESKRKRTVNIISEILNEVGSINQKGMLAKLEEHDNKLNAKTLRAILKDLESKSRIKSTTGLGSEILYRLLDQ